MITGSGLKSVLRVQAWKSRSRWNEECCFPASCREGACCYNRDLPGLGSGLGTRHLMIDRYFRSDCATDWMWTIVAFRLEASPRQCCAILKLGKILRPSRSTTADFDSVEISSQAGRSRRCGCHQYQQRFRIRPRSTNDSNKRIS